MVSKKLDSKLNSVVTQRAGSQSSMGDNATKLRQAKTSISPAILLDVVKYSRINRLSSMVRKACFSN